MKSGSMHALFYVHMACTTPRVLRTPRLRESPRISRLQQWQSGLVRFLSLPIPQLRRALHLDKSGAFHGAHLGRDRGNKGSQRLQLSPCTVVQHTSKVEPSIQKFPDLKTDPKTVNRKFMWRNETVKIRRLKARHTVIQARSLWFGNFIFSLGSSTIKKAQPHLSLRFS